MAELYKHLRIKKEKLVNDRRTRQFKIPRIRRGDLVEHGRWLSNALDASIAVARRQEGDGSDRFILKLKYTGILNFANLHKHGISFISQEERNVCVVFASERGLAQFSEHLTKLGIEDTELTYAQILEAFDSIDNWTASDRTSWAIEHRGLPSLPVFPLDVELWPLDAVGSNTRTNLIREFECWLDQVGIRRIDAIDLDSLLMYRLSMSREQAVKLLEHRDVRFVDLVPQTGISYSQMNADIAALPTMIPSPPENSARVCMLDSGVNSNHPLLRPAIAEATNFVNGQDAGDDAGHGTAVAGVILYGDLEACATSNYWHPEFWLFSGKILYLDPDTKEARFDPRTVEHVITDAVAYHATVNRCRIFNLSIGNANAPYDNRHIKGIAYVLDKLAREYNVLFVVSTGNFNGSDDPPVPQESWRDEYPGYLGCPESAIIDPAPALNVITVGSVARHNAHANEQRYPEIYALTPAGEDQPSPFTRHGPSVRGAVKPELMAVGGNTASPMRTNGQQWRADARGMGVLTLNHAFLGATLFKEISGTSFSAPYVTHLAGRLLNEYPEASANMLRAMLINQAKQPDASMGVFSETDLTHYKTQNSRDLARDVLGYGTVDVDNLFRSSESAVVLHVDDAIQNNSHLFYELPLPDVFLRGTGLATRELKISLAYTPPVRTTRIDYVATKIFFRLVRGDTLAQVQDHFNHATQDENETRNDDATTNRTITAQLRDKGTVQLSTWRFRRLNPKIKWFVVVTRQDRDWGEVLCQPEEGYALVVTVTDRENRDPQLYAQIQSRIQVQERERERARV